MHRQLAVGEGNLLAHALGRGRCYDVVLGKATLVEHCEHLAAHEAGGSYYCYGHLYLISVTVPRITLVTLGSNLLV